MQQSVSRSAGTYMIRRLFYIRQKGHFQAKRLITTSASSALGEEMATVLLECCPLLTAAYQTGYFVSVPQQTAIYREEGMPAAVFCVAPRRETDMGINQRKHTTREASHQTHGAEGRGNTARQQGSTTGKSRQPQPATSMATTLPQP